MKLKYHELLSNFAFNVNLRRYTMVSEMGFDVAASALGLAPSITPVGTCRLTLSNPS